MQLIQTDDGSNTLYNEEINEHYHSTFGAISESKHVFIQYGLHYALQLSNNISIFEVGFGTGLNALLTYAECQNLQNTQIHYHTVEAFPLLDTIYSQLNYPTLIDCNNAEEIFNQLHQQKWDEKPNTLNHSFSISKYHKELQTINLPPNQFHVIYFDAFAPDIQPELWDETIFKNMFKLLVDGGCLVTYSAKGSIRRAMKAAGFTIEKLPGAPGKREMTRAIKKLNQDI